MVNPTRTPVPCPDEATLETCREPRFSYRRSDSGRGSLARIVATIVWLASLGLSAGASAQFNNGADTTAVYELDEIVLIGERTERQLSLTTGAAGLVEQAALRAFPTQNVADVLRLAPGFAFLSLDGLGYDSQPTVRGFYGGGEAEYVTLLVDGEPINSMESGLVDWAFISPELITSAAYLRGPGSSAYGDVATGGVVSLTTRPVRQRFGLVSLHGGSFGTYRGTAEYGTPLGHRSSLAVSGSVDRTGGFRNDSERTIGRVGARGAIGLSAASTIRISLNHHWNDGRVPGPLTGANLDSSRTLVAPFFRFDENNQSRTYGRIELSHPLGERLELTARLAGEARSVEAFETLALSPDFADTKFRDLATRRGSGLVALRLSEFSDRLPGQLVVGLEGALGSMTSSYAGVLTGDRSVYESSDSVEAGDVLAASDVDRATLSAFVHVEINPADRLRLTAGARFDGIGDDFQPAPPSEGDDASDSHRALSPKLGVNYRFLSTNNHVGNVYGSIGHTFKAPTLDQLYDQRTIPVPFPPFEISLSSSGLKPQRGWSYEIGAYYRANVGPSARVEGTLAVYQIDMRDELDFDLETLSYLNIGKSRHRGVEAGVRAYLGSRASAFVNYTHQAVTLEYGANSGKYVKAIPRNVVRGGIEGSVGGGFGGSVAVSHTGSVYLDDANTIPLSDFTSADAQVWFERAQVRFAVQVINLLDSEHSSTGYPDPAGSQVLYLYPVAGRHFRAGLTIQLGGA